MHIGVVLPQIAADWPEVAEWARLAEDGGADSIWVVDHVLGRSPEQGILEAWTLMSALAVATSRVEIGAQVLCQSFRSPALLAKMAATLDLVSSGRLRLMIGTGWYEQEYLSFGWDFPEPRVRVDQLTETVKILKGLLGGTEPFTFSGTHYRVDEAINTPQPLRSRMPIEVGGVGDRMLRLIARECDGWNCPGAFLGMLDDRLAFLSKACADAGRSIGDLRLTIQVACAVGDDDAATQPFVNFFGGERALTGSVEDVAGKIKDFQDKGIEGVHAVFPRGDQGKACLERLLGEVRPQLV